MDLAEDILTTLAVAVWVVGGVWVSIYDVREHILPTRIIFPTAVAVLAFHLATAITIQDIIPLAWAAAGGIGCYAGFYALYLINPKAMGGGDVRLAGLNGLLLGWFGPAHPWIAIAVALVLSFPSAIVLVFVKGPKYQAAFGPFMVAGTAVIAGYEIIPIYF